MGALVGMALADDNPGWTEERIIAYHVDKLSIALSQILSTCACSLRLIESILESTYRLFFGTEKQLVAGFMRSMSIPEATARDCVKQFRKGTRKHIPKEGWTTIRLALEATDKQLTAAYRREMKAEPPALAPDTADALTDLFYPAESDPQG